MAGEWQEYDGDYCKAMQDIRLKNGDEVLMCWPNAGFWITMRPGKYANKDIPNRDVTHVRKTNDKNW
jgi:hypothetical protein